jgi:ribosomal protein L37AE/L43A
MSEECICPSCGNDFDYRRFRLGYNYCLDCGDIRAERQRDAWCIVPLPKQAYTLVTSRSDLLHLNQKTR